MKEPYMKDNQHPVNFVMNLIENSGINALLPHNLTNELLHKVMMEGDAIEAADDEDVSIPTLLMIVLNLRNGKKISTTKEITVEISPEELWGHFEKYIAALRLEDMKRKGKIEIKEADLPTVDNIFL